MTSGLLAKKVGMTQIFDATGDCVPVTVLECGPCTVVRRKTAEKDGYDAVVIGFSPIDEKHAYRLSKPELGVFKKAGTAIFRHLQEVRVKDAKALGDLKAGDVLTVDKVFKLNQRIDVTGTTKGRGFQGVFKRWGMKGAARDSSTAHDEPAQDTSRSPRGGAPACPAPPAWKRESAARIAPDGASCGESVKVARPSASRARGLPASASSAAGPSTRCSRRGGRPGHRAPRSSGT